MTDNSTDKFIVPAVYELRPFIASEYLVIYTHVKCKDLLIGFKFKKY